MFRTACFFVESSKSGSRVFLYQAIQPDLGKKRFRPRTTEHGKGKVMIFVLRGFSRFHS